MKKGLVFVMISLIVFSVGMVLAELCTGDFTNSPTGCVCGRSPNSSIGYGQIIIGGANSTIISCNNILDGICPEDFQDGSTGMIGNCSSCPDPDCIVSNGTGYVWGYVKDIGGKPIRNVIITGHPIKTNVSANLDTNTTTNSYGLYNSSDFISGRYYFSASKEGYDTQLIEETVVRSKITRIDFTLPNGTCHSDCTNSYNRCNAACDGVTFSNGTASCNFNNTFGTLIKDNCNNREKGTEVYLGPAAGNSSYSWFVKCCDNAPYLKYYYTAFIDGNNIKNLIKTEKIARYNDVPVRIIVAYW